MPPGLRWLPPGLLSLLTPPAGLRTLELAGALRSRLADAENEFNVPSLNAVCSLVESASDSESASPEPERESWLDLSSSRNSHSDESDGVAHGSVDCSSFSLDRSLELALGRSHGELTVLSGLLCEKPTVGRCGGGGAGHDLCTGEDNGIGN